jgi:hypothetical protein
MIDINSLFTYACDDVRFQRKGRPEVWTTVGQVNGTMFRSYPLFEFVPGERGGQEPKRYGDFVIDIDTGEQAVKDAIRIVDHFSTVYGIDQEQWKIFLSGKKGVHLELPMTILGTEKGSQFLTLGYKRLAKDIEGELKVKLDTSMYNVGTGKPYRQPNVMRETGTCKRQITYDDLYEITDEETYKLACSEPGKTWEPDNTERNILLADKVVAYLADAEKDQESIRNAPQLTSDEIDQLALSRPACISVLANLTEAKSKANYNEVAMQLTAYAVTVGATEQEFMDGCAPFINNYYTSSLTTIKARHENCRARYRTMAAHGHKFSCGGILSLGVPGFDCAKCESKPAGPAVSVEVITDNDLTAFSLATKIPDHILNPGGLISLAMEALPVAGAPDIPQFALPSVLTVIANAIAGKLAFERVWPNVFNIKVGSTSLGKSDTDKIIKQAMEDYAPEQFYGPTGFASGPALLRALNDNPRTMLVLDECTNLFKRYQQADPLSDGIRDTLLEVFSSSGGKINRVYSDKQKSIKIDRPCVSLTGNATPVIIDAIKNEDFATGTMQRFDFWCYDGPATERVSAEIDCAKLNSFCEGVAKIYASVPPGGNLAGANGIPHCVQADEKAREIIQEWSRSIIAEANGKDNEGEKGIVSRQYHLALKYALIHMAATRPVESLYEPMRAVDIEYGKAVAWMLADWKMNVLMERVIQGEFHRMCTVFKQAVLSAIRNGKRPTFAVMAHRKPELKNWKMKDSKEVIDVLVKRGEIVLDESKRNTAYYIVKGK